jgi:alkanesulfonate monooxygenase SsuD/methylene tetrahydromethanopterin reductase-like flavin-dependent oxidoreductase (luciferase family)
MRFDLFMEFATPPLGGGTGARRSFEGGILLARAAEAAGLDAVWSAEHHFLGDYSNAAAPDMLLAAIARETRRIELGFAIVPLTLHDPVRVAERLATLDLLSGGRAMWGVGRGVTVTELEGFGVDPAESRSLFRDRFDELRGILETGTVRRAGRLLAVSPKPERPLPRGWLAAVSPESFELAAELGLNVMAGPFKPWPMVKADLAAYRRLHPNGQTSFTLAVYCEDDRRAARKRAEPGLQWAYRRLLDIARPMLERRRKGYEDYRRLGWLAPLLERTVSVPVLEKLGLAAVGDPDHVARRLFDLRASGLDRVSLVIGGGDLTVEETTRCVDLIARHALPALRRASQAPKTVGAES